MALAALGCGSSATSDLPRELVVVRRDIEDVFLLTGELTAVRSLELGVPRLSGMGGGLQVKWVAEEGADVAAGDVVVELDNSRISGTLEERRMRATQAAIALEQREATLAAERAQKAFESERSAVDLEQARIEAAVPQELRARKEWHEKQQALVRAEAAHEKARLADEAHVSTAAADLRVLGIALDKAQREVAVAEQSLRGLQLRAPRAGVVLLGRSPQNDRPIQQGDNLWPGWRAATLPDLTELEVLAFLPEVDDGRVQVGQAARVILDSALREVIAGRVETVAAVAQDARYAGGFRVRIALERNDPARMRPGLSARVEVVRRVFAGALVVPRSAVIESEGRALVRRPGGGRSEVALEACLALECVISKGLAEGDRVSAS